MCKNVFETLKSRKEKLKGLIEKAGSFGWIDKERKHTLLQKIDSDTLTIGVIGQIKCGKSTFLNSFVFEDTILPAATTPMTAALSVITYGEKEKIVAEFYTSDEWAEQQMQADRSLDDAQGNAAEESKIKAAKELVSKAYKLGSNLNQLLGKTKEDDFNNLIEYVGANGKYVSITKAVTIYHPKEHLKGVEIVDTPGFNDPIVSREERTKEFLKRADVVLMMLYAGRPFDATDRDIIFKNVRQCGIGKVLIGINKYDIPYCSETNPEDETQIQQYVIDEIKKACRECDDNILCEILNDTTPIPLSAEMALLSQLPMGKIKNSEELSFAWKRHCDNFGISTQQDFYDLSHISNLSKAVTELVLKEKNNIIFSKPINAIIAAGAKLASDTEKEIFLTKSNIDLLQKPDDEIEEQEDKLNKAHQKLDKRISSLGEDIDFEMKYITRKGRNDLENDVDDACKKASEIIDNEWKLFTNYNTKIEPKLTTILNTLKSRTLRNRTEHISSKAIASIIKCIRDFFDNDVEEILLKYLPNSESHSFIHGLRNRIDIEITKEDLFSISSDNLNKNASLLDYIEKYFNNVTFGLTSIIFRVLSYDEDKRKVYDWINSIKYDFKPKPYLNAVISHKDRIIETVREALLKELIVPLKNQLTEIESKKKNKETSLKEANSKLERLNKSKESILGQIAEIEAISKNIR